MIGELDDSDFSIGTYARDPERSLAEVISIHRVKPIVTAELLRHFLPSIQAMGQRLRRNPYLLRRTNERAGQFADHQCRRVRSGFFMLSILDPQHISRILDQSMLEPSSGADERPAPLARESDSPQRAIHAFVRAGWGTPQGIKRLQHGFAAFLIQ
jgi:hypothetical protein